MWGSGANAPQVRAGHSLDDAGCPLPVFEIPYALLPIEDPRRAHSVGHEKKVPIKPCRDSGMTNLS